MIEVPSAVVLARELARRVQFFSIGTNDLTQYVLAMDRLNPALAKQTDALHPAVLRMIKQTVDAADEAGIWVGVCGGVAGEPEGASILAGLGVRELSVSPPAVAAVKAHLREQDFAALQALATKALACATAPEVRALGGGVVSRRRGGAPSPPTRPIDHTVWVPGFAAGEVNRVARETATAGGKGVNVAADLAALGVSTVVTGFLGRDNVAVFESRFAAASIADRFVRVDGSTRTNMKIVDDGRPGFTTDVNFPGIGPSPADVDDLTELVAELAADARWVVLAGSLPPDAPGRPLRPARRRRPRRRGARWRSTPRVRRWPPRSRPPRT